VVGVSVAAYAHFYRCHKAWYQDEKLDRLKFAFPNSKQTVSGENKRPPISSTPRRLRSKRHESTVVHMARPLSPRDCCKSFERAVTRGNPHPHSISEQQLESPVRHQHLRGMRITATARMLCKMMKASVSLRTLDIVDLIFKGRGATDHV
jgi:hypothetical protein